MAGEYKFLTFSSLKRSKLYCVSFSGIPAAVLDLAQKTLLSLKGKKEGEETTKYEKV
jgi:hypothetical protein